MPSMPKNLPFFIIASSASYYAELETSGKKKSLKNLTKIDFPVIENGKFLEDKLKQALEKLDQKTLYLVISDEIFLHHIGEFPLKSPQSLEDQISDTVATAFPDQNESLHIVTLNLAKTSKTKTIQITAMSRENLHVLSRVCNELKITVKMIMPASFAVKGFVSIDPSLFILETPDDVWVTSHYIGVEHAESLGSTDSGKLQNAVTQIKNQKPHLQHAYLCGEKETVSSFTEALKDVLPTQEVEVKGVDAEDECPLMVKVLTVGLKDVVENKFPFPEFKIETNPDKAKKAESESADTTPAADTASDEDKDSDDADTKEEAMPKKDDTNTEEKVTKPEPESDGSAESTDTPEPVKKPTTTTPPETPKVTPPTPPKPATPPTIPPTVAPAVKPVTPAAPPTAPASPAKPATPTSPAMVTPAKKSKSSIGKYLLLAGGIALIIGLIGGGIVISQQALQSQNEPQQEETMEPEETPAVEETPEPTPESETEPIAKDEVSILILNATGVAGKAGATADTFDEAGYTDADTGNAKGEYEQGTYIMVKDEEQAALVEQLRDDTELELEEIDYDEAEDSDGEYDVIIILAE